LQKIRNQAGKPKQACRTLTERKLTSKQEISKMQDKEASEQKTYAQVAKQTNLMKENKMLEEISKTLEALNNRLEE